MSAFPDYPFLYSDPPDPNEQPPSTFFNSLPYRKSRFHDAAVATSLAVVRRTADSLGVDFNSLVQKGCVTSTGHMISWTAPEWPPILVPLLTEMCESLLHYDDAIDTLDIKNKRDALTDATLGLLRMWKLNEAPHFDADVNKTFISNIESLLESTPELRTLILKTFIETIMAQATSIQSGVSFEEYKKARMASSTIRPAWGLVALIQGLRITEEEKQSVAPILDYGVMSGSLSNDYYSFHREFDEHMKSGTLDAIHNAMALLMTEYGYSEEEAGDILKQEVLAAEKQLMQHYEAWEASDAPKSDNIRSYVVLFILAVGGGNYWQSQSSRYRNEGMTTTIEDRARLLQPRREHLLRLEGYPSPANLDGSCPLSEVIGRTAVSEAQTVLATNSHSTKGDIFARFQPADADKICMAPFDYIKSLPGKNTLGRFIDCLRAWFNLRDEHIAILTKIAVMLFNSTLLLDDIEDGSALRRGQPAAHVKFGVGQTVNSATFLHAEAVSLVLEHLGPDCLNIVLDEIKTLARGQALDLHWTFIQARPTVNEYLTMVDHKTGGFFRLVLRAMGSLSSTAVDSDLEHLVTLMGRYYQIRDDHQNLASDEYTAKKGFCDDLSEGKFSFPIIHLLQHSSKANTLFKLIYDRQNGDISHADKLYVLTEMKECESLTYASEVLDELFTSIVETLDRLEEKMGQNKQLRCLILSLKL
ncbi:polyprenyl synthetase family protein [Aspergillus clavatus NRRL 1]|uniref:Geranylgeranyl pyrophosphate synthase n=1 Tax=Aspergillus clavatus (strain ATCC 1007 / CBS 513.65 / DSM 816 / NCTC 3887 / NRRL 1 / QM 1276 / 107) TaxID=344612 RepID=A1C6V8_ASPCL|nr:geranylgeranyl pyrophosphate synthase [Aspergillus clavatus NRRL 1]EAW14129.1 geranylgeranyl pyrophosphate synthase [Aspergillus clavatus NRRL 1]